jgi:hypothetical protein
MHSLKSLTNDGTDMGADFENGAAVGIGMPPAAEKGDAVALAGAASGAGDAAATVLSAGAAVVGVALGADSSATPAVMANGGAVSE